MPIPPGDAAVDRIHPPVVVSMIVAVAVTEEEEVAVEVIEEGEEKEEEGEKEVMIMIILITPEEEILEIEEEIEDMAIVIEITVEVAVVVIVTTVAVAADLDSRTAGVVGLEMTEVEMTEALHPLNVPDSIWPNVPYQSNLSLSKPVLVLVLAVPMSLLNLRNQRPTHSEQRLLQIRRPSLQPWTLKKKLHWTLKKKKKKKSLPMPMLTW